MFDSINDVNYIMIVRCGEIEFGASNEDSLYYQNFANLLHFGHNSYFSIEPSGEIDGTIINPIEDKFGHRWAFWYGGFSSVEDRKNVLIGDSLHLEFGLSNLPYYSEDSVPFQEIETVHRGKKIH